VETVDSHLTERFAVARLRVHGLFHEQKKQIEKANAILTRAREVLLPRLISGRLSSPSKTSISSSRPAWRRKWKLLGESPGKRWPKKRKSNSPSIVRESTEVLN
jgi:hypothetical protein